jgi:hypothetical protein
MTGRTQELQEFRSYRRSNSQTGDNDGVESTAQFLIAWKSMNRRHPTLAGRRPILELPRNLGLASEHISEFRSQELQEFRS